MNLIHDTDQWQALMNTEMNLGFHKWCEISWSTEQLLVSQEWVSYFCVHGDTNYLTELNLPSSIAEPFVELILCLLLFDSTISVGSVLLMV